MDFQGAALKDVLKILSQQAGINFVATRNIEGRQVTVYMDDVTIEDALQSIMTINDLAYEQPPGSAVFIVKEAEAVEVELITKIYPLKHIRLSSLGKMKMKGQGNIVQILDQIVVKKTGAAGGIAVDDRTNSLVITSIEENFPIIEETIKELDRRSLQALIEAEIVEIHTTAVKKLGLDWGGTTSGTFVTFTGPETSTKFPFVRETGFLKSALLGGAPEKSSELGTLTLEEFSIVIKALEIEGLAKFLAKPRVMVLNNETAEMKIMTDSALASSEVNITETGQLETTIEREETGVSLKVTPAINEDGYITMTLEPEVSRVVQAAIHTTSAPVYDPAKRTAKTTVMTKDGQTIAIGGLLSEETSDSHRATPFVSKIPLLGNLFQSESSETDETEIIIFVTAHVIEELQELDVTSLSKEGGSVSQGAMQTEQGVSPLSEVEDTAFMREVEIEKTVKRLRKKRELSK